MIGIILLVMMVGLRVGGCVLIIICGRIHILEEKEDRVFSGGEGSNT